MSNLTLTRPNIQLREVVSRLQTLQMISERRGSKALRDRHSIASAYTAHQVTLRESKYFTIEQPTDRKCRLQLPIDDSYQPADMRTGKRVDSA